MKSLSRKITGLPVSAALSVDLLAKEMEASGKNIINFCVGEPDFDTPEKIREAGKRAIDEGETRYTNAPGSPELRDMAAAWFLKNFGASYSRAEVAVTTGGKYGVFAAVSALTDPGDEVILPAPYWTSYYHIITIAGAVPVVLETKEEEGYKVTPEMVRRACTEKTKAIILNNPNNPSGAVYSEPELLALSEVFREEDLYVVSDEIYDRLVYTEAPFTSVASLSEDMKKRAIVINGVSKRFAMTGWRIGLMFADPKIIKAVSAFLSHTTGCPSAISQKAAIEALKTGDPESLEMLKVFQERRDIIVEGLKGLPGLSFTVPEGAFYLMLSIRDEMKEKYHDGEGFSMALLKEAGVAAVPCRDYGVPGAVRISFSIDTEELREGIRRIRDFCKKV